MARVAWLLFVALGLTAVVAAQAQKEDPPETHQADDDFDLRELVRAKDLRPQIERVKRKDGLHELRATKSGLRISVRAERGRVLEYVATDRQGKSVQPEAFSLSRGTGATAAKTIRCWHCYRNPDGSYDCFQVECPFKAP